MQQAGESFEQFLTELKLLVKDCGHADLDEMVRDRVVIGCYSSKAWEKLIHEGSDLTLEKAIDIARKEEIWQAQLETMATENPSINSVKTKKQKTKTKTVRFQVAPLLKDRNGRSYRWRTGVSEAE